MKNLLFTLIFLITSVQGFSQSLNINHYNPNPTLTSLIECDTILIDYNLGYDTLMYDEINSYLLLSLVELTYVHDEGYTEYRYPKKNEIKNKVIIVYSSEWGTRKVINN